MLRPRWNSLILFASLLAEFSSAAEAPRVLYLCSDCDQYQMAYTEDLLSQVAARRGVGVLKLGDSSEYSKYAEYLKKHPESKLGNFRKIPRPQLSWADSFPKDEAEAKARQKEFQEKRNIWKGHILAEFKKLDRTRPVVIHFGNHGVNESPPKPGSASPLCMFSRVSNIRQCLTYDEIGDLLQEAGLTGPQAPPLKLIGDHCHGGGVHTLASRFSNVCSASVVGYRNLQWSPDLGFGSEASVDGFGSTFWRTVLQDGSRASLGHAFQSAWSRIPSSDHPGGTLSSIYYAQAVLNLEDEALPTHDRLPALSALEASFASLDGLMGKNRSAYSEGRGMRYFERPSSTCTVPDQSPLDLRRLQSTLTALQLNDGKTIYSQALSRAREGGFFGRGAQALASMNQCWVAAGRQYADAPLSVQKQIDQNGNWALKNLFRSEQRVEQENRAFLRNQENKLAFQVLDELKACLAQHQSLAREYLSTVQTLKTLENLGNFAKKATPSQKLSFRRKVECESSPLF